MPTFSAHTRGYTIPSATPNVTKDTSWFENAHAASSLADRKRRGQEFYQDVKLEFGHVIIVAHTHAYVYTR